MASLNATEQRWIVVQLALFEEPKDVVKAFAEQFPGKTVTRQQVWEYDCSKEANRERRSEELIDLFEETREEFKAQVEDVAIANKAWRLRELNDLYRSAKVDGRTRAAAQLLEQAAKDVGDAFTNKKDLTSGGQPFKALQAVDVDAV